MGITSIFDLLHSPLNLAHVEDRKAESLLKQREVDYPAAIECHQRAHAHLRTAQLNIPSRDMHNVDNSNRHLVDSLYAQMEHHMTQQSVLLQRQKKDIIELKRKPYIASIREKTAELAMLDAVKYNEILQKQLSQQETLMDSLKDKLDQEAVHACLTNDDLDILPNYAKKKPKATSDTLEELKDVNYHLKELIDQLVTENTRLKEQLGSGSHTKSQENEWLPSNDDDGCNYMDSLPGDLEIEPLGAPPPFEIPEESLRDSTSL